MRNADTVTSADGVVLAIDTAQVLRRVAELAGHDHGWQHAVAVVTGSGSGGLWVCVVPQRFHPVACAYRRAFAQGTAAFYATTDMVPPSQIAEALS